MTRCVSLGDSFEGPWQMRSSLARAVIAAAFFLLEMNDMSNHAISFEGNQIGAPPDGWTSTLTDREIQNGRSKPIPLRRPNRPC